MVGIFARVQLYGMRSDPVCELNRCQIGRDEQAGADPGPFHLDHSPLYTQGVRCDVKATFGGDLFPFLGDERHLIRAHEEGHVDHRVRARDFKIEETAHAGAEGVDVGVLNVPPVLAQVSGDSVCTGRFAQHGGRHWVRLSATARLPQRRHVVDVHIKALVACSHIRPEYNFLRMKKLLLVLALGGVSACQPTPPSTRAADNAPGAPTPEAAVQRFFNAARAQDLQAISNVWGTEKGPARDNMERADLEKREVILQCYFNNDTYRILGVSPTAEGRRTVRVELVRQGQTRMPTVYTVRGPSSRWYVENLDIAAVRDFCGMAPIGPTGQ